jgi:hypothetical protein
MKKLLFLLLISFGCFAQKDTTIVKRKVVKITNNFYIEENIISYRYRLFDVNMIETVDRKDDEELSVLLEINRKNKELVDKNAEKIEFQKHFKDAIKLGYVPEITNSREQEIYQKLLKKIK